MAKLYDYDKPLKISGYLAPLLNTVSEEAKFLTLVRHGESPAAVLAEWSVDLPKRSGDPTGAEGADKTDGYSNSVPEVLRGYAMRVESAGWHVTDLSELTATAYSARKAEAARQQAKDAKAGLLAVQDYLLGDHDTQDGHGNDNKYKTRSVYSWLSTSAQSNLPVPAACRPRQSYSGTLSDFDEAALQRLLAGAADEIDQDVNLVAFVGPSLGLHMASFAARAKAVDGVAQFTQLVSPQDANRIVRKVQFFDYVGGSVKVVVQRRQFVNLAGPNTHTEYTGCSGFFIDPSVWGLDWMQPWHHEPQDDNGGGPRGFHKGWVRLVCKCPLGQFAVKISDGSSSSSSSSSESSGSSSESSGSSSSSSSGSNG